tara:strand:- start:79 stop:1086 length:1008 start_codon:yes stop_codon:yes gene_type:complete
MALPTEFFKLGSGMLEQGLDNQRLAAERKFKIIEDLSPLVLKEIEDKKTLLKAETETKSNLSKFYKPNEINLLLNANKNLLYSTEPLADAQKLITSMGGTNKFTSAAENFKAPELQTGTQEELDNFKKFYTENIAEQTGTGTTALDFVLGNRSNTIEDQQTAETEAPVETAEQPMVDSQEVSTSPILRDIAFGSTDAFVQSDAGAIALADKKQDKRADNMTTYKWLQTDVDINTGETDTQFTGSDFTPVPRQDYYTIEYNKQVSGSSQGNNVAQDQARINIEGGTSEITPVVQQQILDVIASGDIDQIKDLQEFLKDQNIPYADAFPQLDSMSAG